MTKNEQHFLHDLEPGTSPAKPTRGAQYAPLNFSPGLPRNNAFSRLLSQNKNLRTEH